MIESMNSDLHDALHTLGLRVTEPRLAVFEAVQSHPHADTETILDATRAALPSVSHQAVYDGLRTLAEAGLVRRIQPAGSLARYEVRVGDNHHHLVCQVCGRVEDIDCVVGEAPCLTPNDDHGFVVQQAEVTFWGTCADCAPDADRAADAGRTATDDRATSAD